MDKNIIQELIDRYVSVSFQVQKKAEYLIKGANRRRINQ